MSTSRRRVSNVFAMALTLLLAGCSAFAPAKSFDQQLAYAYGTHTAVLQAATSAVQAGTLSPEDGEAVLKLSDESRAVLDAARLAAGTGDMQTAEGQLALAVGVLTELQNYLRSHQK